jgi:hypothetical protein
MGVRLVCVAASMQRLPEDPLLCWSCRQITAFQFGCREQACGLREGLPLSIRRTRLPITGLARRARRNPTHGGLMNQRWMIIDSDDVWLEVYDETEGWTESKVGQVAARRADGTMRRQAVIDLADASAYFLVPAEGLSLSDQRAWEGPPHN